MFKDAGAMKSALQPNETVEVLKKKVEVKRVKMKKPKSRVVEQFSRWGSNKNPIKGKKSSFQSKYGEKFKKDGSKFKKPSKNASSLQRKAGDSTQQIYQPSQQPHQPPLLIQPQTHQPPLPIQPQNYQPRLQSQQNYQLQTHHHSFPIQQKHQPRSRSPRQTSLKQRYSTRDHLYQSRSRSPRQTPLKQRSSTQDHSYQSRSRSPQRRHYSQNSMKIESQFSHRSQQQTKQKIIVAPTNPPQKQKATTSKQAPVDVLQIKPSQQEQKVEPTKAQPNVHQKAKEELAKSINKLIPNNKTDLLNYKVQWNFVNDEVKEKIRAWMLKELGNNVNSDMVITTVLVSIDAHQTLDLLIRNVPETVVQNSQAFALKVWKTLIFWTEYNKRAAQGS